MEYRSNQQISTPTGGRVKDLPTRTVQYTSVLSEDSEDDVCVFPVAAYVMTSKNNRVWYRTYLSNWILTRVHKRRRRNGTERNENSIVVNPQLAVTDVGHVTCDICELWMTKDNDRLPPQNYSAR